MRFLCFHWYLCRMSSTKNIWSHLTFSQGFHWSGKVREITDFLEKVRKVREENFYPFNFLTSIKKSFQRRNVCSWILCNNQFYIWCCYFHLVLRWFNIDKHFYFNLSEVVFHLDQEREHAINYVVFFVKGFIVVKILSSRLLRQFEW